MRNEPVEPFTHKLEPIELNALYRLGERYQQLMYKMRSQGQAALTDDENMNVLTQRAARDLENAENYLGDRLYELCMSVYYCTELDYSNYGVCPYCMDRGNKSFNVVDLEGDPEEDVYSGEPATMNYDSQSDSLLCDNCGREMSREDWETCFPTYGTDYGQEHIMDFMNWWLRVRNATGHQGIVEKYQALHFIITALHGSGAMAPMFFAGKTRDIYDRLDQLSGVIKDRSASSFRSTVRFASSLDYNGSPEIADSLDILLFQSG